MSDGLDPRPEASVGPVEDSVASALLSEGKVLGDRYRIDRLLGRGGMGELWLAVDLKLRVEVALKSIHPHLFSGEQELEMLRREVLAARQVVSPNVCRIFDLVEIDGHELVSMEYVDGTTLLDVLREEGGLEIHRASDIASQFLAGLQAIHESGLVHRDVKPENLMVTRAGRVLLMDFGVAKEAAAESSGSVSGTPAYMPPEQARGEAVDARADVFAAGVVLAELMSGEAVADLTSRQTLWRGLHRDPPEVREGPWARVIRKAVSKEPADRYASAKELARVLEEATLRTVQAEDVTPYPGLASFTETEAEFFFGREAEVEALWKKLRKPHLHALIGPSGAGKTSFVRAGLIPAMPEGWRAIVCQPGDRPLVALASALVSELSGDEGALRKLVRFEEPEVAVELFRGWRARHEQVLLVVDQFEELFTLNSTETQAAVAELLGRLVLEADVHVLLAMRDDFFHQCNRQPALAPVFSEVTPLDPPAGGALRRAVIQPALQCGYRFEDEELVDAMLAEVEGERGALPLLAFTVALLWERRDRDTGLLTRTAYEEIGGVAGALAGHAEETMDRIGRHRQKVVREIFRNLVTAEGTRAFRDRQELLSVFPGADAAEEVLRKLIEARLLTSYELPREAGRDGAEAWHRIEIIHESLLSHWPRLVRWRTQDADGAQLRDQLRQAARVWDERGRPAELLWTGAPYREFFVWREAYPGGLTATEEAFAGAMQELAGRKRRRRRFAVSSFILFLMVVLAVVGVSMQQAVEESRRSEASELFARGRLELETYPTAALAYALAGLERTDTPSGRRLAIEALAETPPAIVGGENVRSLAFSPDGSRLAAATGDGRILLWSREGGEPRELGRYEGAPQVRFQGGTLISYRSRRPNRFVGVYSQEDFHLLRALEVEGLWELVGGILYTVAPPRTVVRDLRTPGEGKRESDDSHLVQAWPLDGGAPRTVATLEARGHEQVGVDPTGSLLTFVRDGKLFATPLEEQGDGGEWVVAEPPDGVDAYRFEPYERRVMTWALPRKAISIWALDTDTPTLLQRFESGSAYRADVSEEGTLLATCDSSANQINVWSVNGGGMRTFPAPPTVQGLAFSADDRWMAAASMTGQTTHLYDLRAPFGARATVLSRGEVVQANAVAFDPSGRWLATGDGKGLALWPLEPWRLPHVLPEQSRGVKAMAFGPDGGWLALAGAVIERTRIWPLSGEPPRIIWDQGFQDLDVDPSGEYILGGSDRDGVLLVSTDGTTSRELAGFESSVSSVALSPSGRYAAGGGGQFADNESHIHLWDLEGNGSRVLDLGNRQWIKSLLFLSERYLAAGMPSGMGIWDLESDSFDRLVDKTDVWSLASDRGRRVLVGVGHSISRGNDIRVWDIESRDSRAVSSHGDHLDAVAVSPDGHWIVSGDTQGVVRVGPISGGAPHLLLGHKGQVGVAVSPDGQWIASSAADGTVRVWPIPDLSKPPLHTLPHDELLARLRSLTNLRVVKDETEESGYRLVAEEFPGWETVPEW